MVHAENDAFLGAYGELRHGAGRGLEEFLYVKVSHGIGACPVINGRPYHGATGIAGEIGHTRLTAESELCRCGQRGCLEAVVSIDTVRQQVAHSHPGARRVRRTSGQGARRARAHVGLGRTGRRPGRRGVDQARRRVRAVAWAVSGSSGHGCLG